MSLRRQGIAFFTGVLFALGLGVSGMTQPQNIVGFLDIFGDWNPSLIFVMVGAIGFHGISYFFIREKQSPLFAEKFQVPQADSINKRLLVGASVFGMGWGISGFCPGPGVVALASGGLNPLLFVSGLALGMAIFRQAESLYFTKG